MLSRDEAIAKLDPALSIALSGNTTFETRWKLDDAWSIAEELYEENLSEGAEIYIKQATLSLFDAMVDLGIRPLMLPRIL